MKQFTIMDDGELGKLIIQLRRDVHDFWQGRTRSNRIETRRTRA
jgi:hypothetical protein